MPSEAVLLDLCYGMLIFGLNCGYQGLLFCVSFQFHIEVLQRLGLVSCYI